jgi:hypothetical protein
MNLILKVQKLINKNATQIWEGKRKSLCANRNEKKDKQKNGGNRFYPRKQCRPRSADTVSFSGITYICVVIFPKVMNGFHGKVYLRYLGRCAEKFGNL